ncbi:MAG: hypothetical protein CMM25_05460 [Rhodospirillaceae bacterium]|nr:hypothetical protein [Rhodospirillaceae bacterium]
MAEYDALDRLVEFKPFYDKGTTERMLNAYNQKPHLFKPELVNQLKEHAVHHKIDIPEPEVAAPKDSEFNLMRGVRQMGEGFFSGFTTFNVGEPSENEYERIMRSIGSLAGFVGYLPTAPGKILKSKALVEVAQSLRGNSVPLWLGKKATEKVAPIVKTTLGKAAEGRKGAVDDAFKFLLSDKVGHATEGAFSLGVASASGSWQLGVNEMLKAGMHGAVTGGVFRGFAELVNKGGIPKIDAGTGKMVLNAAQKEDRLIRGVASSLFDGLQSSARGETTPEQIYSYLLGAYFGAQETTAGQMKVMKHVDKTRKSADSLAVKLNRADPEGKAYGYDTVVFDPERVEGWDQLSKSEKDSTYQALVATHGTVGQQLMMNAELLEKTEMEPSELQLAQLSGAEEAYKQDQGVLELTGQIKQSQINDTAAKLATKTKVVPEITQEVADNNLESIVVSERNVQAALKPGKAGRGPMNEDYAVPLAGAEVEHHKKIIDYDYDKLDDSIDWIEGGKKFQDSNDPKDKRPIDTQYYGEEGTEYKYSEGGTDSEYQPRVFTPELLELKALVEEQTGYQFNSAVVNRYTGKRSSIGLHADNEPELQRGGSSKRGPVIASLTLGETRDFTLRNNKTKKRTNFKLEDGDILLMKGDTQRNYKHSIGKVKEEVGERINITFRRTNFGQSDPRSPESTAKPIINGNVMNLYTKQMSDEYFGVNARNINLAFDTLNKEDFKDREVIIGEGFGEHLRETAPKTHAHLMSKLSQIENPIDKAEEYLKEQGKLTEDAKFKDEVDIGVAPEVDIEKRAHMFTKRHLAETFEGIADKKLRNEEFVKNKNLMLEILKKEFSNQNYKGGAKKAPRINSEKFIRKIEKAFNTKEFSVEAKGDLRQLLIRQNAQRPIHNMVINFGRIPKGDTYIAKEDIIVGKKNEDGNILEQDFTNENLLQGESAKAIDYAAERYFGSDVKSYMVVDRINVRIGGKPSSIEIGKLNEKRNWSGGAQYDQDKADNLAKNIKSQIIERANEKGYYLAGGKGDSGKLYFFKWHPKIDAITDGVALRKDVNATIKSYAAGLRQRAIDRSDSTVVNEIGLVTHYNALKKEFVKDNRKALGSASQAEVYFDKAFLSNLAWDQDMYGLSESVTGPGKGAVEWLGRNSSIQDAKGFNKRNQIWLTDGFALDRLDFKERYAAALKKSGNVATPLSRLNKINFGLIEDAPKGAKMTDRADLNVEATDGMILVEENFLDALNESFGLPYSGQNKSFIVGEDLNHGALLGKFMFHKASPKASKHMRDTNMHMYMYDSAAKERGTRQFGKLDVANDGTAKYTGETFNMHLTDIKGSLSEKQTDHMMKPQLLPKQLMANLVAHSSSPIAQDTINSFFEETIGTKHRGNEEWNNRLVESMAKDKMTDLEQQLFIDNIKEIGLTEVVEAIKNPIHTDFVSKLYREILRINVEDTAFDYSAGEADRVEYEQTHAEASTIISGLDRMMTLVPDTEVFLYRDVRNYLQAAMKSFVVNRVIRPKWDHSMTVRMRGLDPWLAKETGDGMKVGNMSHMNLEDNAANKALLQKEYGVDNADQLVFLDDMYKDTKWDISAYVGGAPGKKRLEDIWNDYGRGNNEAMKDFFKTISMRVPMDSMSGAHELTFAGFSGIKGHGGIFHPRTMKALGGADLDGDKAFVFFGMKPEHRKMYSDQKYEFMDKNTGELLENKEATVNAEGRVQVEALLENLKKEDVTPYDRALLAKIQKGDEITMQDILTTSTDVGGTPEQVDVAKSPIGKYTVQSRMDISDKAVKGRGQLGPAVSSKQVLNSTYDALINMKVKRYFDKNGNEKSVTDYANLSAKDKKLWTGDNRERLVIKELNKVTGEMDENVVYIKPKTDTESQEFSRALMRAQIGFGSDPLDELGLTGYDRWFDLAYNSMFEVEGLQDGQNPRQLKKGIYKIMKNFNDAYFSRNWEKNRRYHIAEIMEMNQGLELLKPEQRNTMLPKMVEILKDMDYSDDIASRINWTKLQKRYVDYDQTIVELLSLTDKGKLLNRSGFTSKPNPLIKYMLEQDISDYKTRSNIVMDPEKFEAFFGDPVFKNADDTVGKKGNKYNGGYVYGTAEMLRLANPNKYSSWYTKQKGGSARFEHDYDRAQTYRNNVMEAFFRDTSEFMQFDALDRASGKQLVKAIKAFNEKGGTKEFLESLSKAAEDVKSVDHALRAVKEEARMMSSDEYSKLNAKEREEVRKLLDTKDKAKASANVATLNAKIFNYKYRNAKKDGKALSKEEAFLFDTLMMSTYHRGKDYTALDSYKNLNAKTKAIVMPYIRSLAVSNSGTYFHRVGLSSNLVQDKPIADFLNSYADEFRFSRNESYSDALPVEIIDNLLTERKTAESQKDAKKEADREVPEMPYEEDYQGLGSLRAESVADLNTAQREMVDELAGHINYYKPSFKEDNVSLNKIVRSVLRKNLDAMNVDDYRTLNNFFRQMRSGNMFIEPGKLTKEGVVKLSQRHWMLFPKTVSDELMMKDFGIFEQKGMFQNYNGDWVQGVVGKPVQVIEHIQYAVGMPQDMATKMDTDEKNHLHEELKRLTGYETIEGGLGDAFFSVATGLRDYKYSRHRASDENRSMAEKHSDSKAAIANLRDVYQKAGWEDTKDKNGRVIKKGNKNKRFKVTVGTSKGKPNVEFMTGQDVVKNIDNVLTEQTIRVMGWIRGKQWEYNKDAGRWVKKEESQSPLAPFFVRLEDGLDGKMKIQYHDGAGNVPMINVEKFSKYLLNSMKEGKPLDIGFGLDNLRVVNRSMRLDQLKRDLRSGNYDKAQKEAIQSMIDALKTKSLNPTGELRADSYHPHMIENKGPALASIKEQINSLNAQLKSKTIEADLHGKKVAKLIHRFRNLTGNWHIDDIVETNMFEDALQAIVDKRLDAPVVKDILGQAKTGNMQSRETMLPGWATDIGAWEVYQKNVIDTFHRQVGQIVSKKMLNDFTDYATKTWKDPKQVQAWNAYITDYITRSLGSPSRIPDHWLDGPEADLMNVKATPYSWWADNRVADKVNKIKKKLGFKGDLELPEELRGFDEMDIRHWSNLEAKYQMATLLAHPKSAVANIFGGTMHTIQSTGWRNWRNARNIDWLRTNLGQTNWTTKTDLDNWAIGHGVVPDFIMNEANLNPNFRGGKWKSFLDDAKKLLDKDPMVKDETLISLASKHKISEAAFQNAAWFMREPERMLRRDSFVAHYLQARELYGHSNMELDHPLLIEMAKKGVKATQFLYSAPYRPAFSATSMGKMMTRFQTWAWNSVRFRNDTYKQAKMYGFRQGTPEMERFKRQYMSDMLVFGLGNVFAYSIFESAMPQPYSWFQDTADWIFGNEEERDRAFFGQWPSAVAPLQMVTPPGLRMVPATFSAIMNNDFSRIADYHMWTMFPFGRLARDVTGVIKNPMRTVEKSTGLPYMQFHREATKYRKEDEVSDTTDK